MSVLGTYLFAQVVSVEPIALAPLVVGEAHTNVSFNGGSDGTITISPSGGSGNYAYAWTDGPITQNRAGLFAGNYHVNVSDLTTLEVVGVNVTITQPQIIPQPSLGSFLFFPSLNSIRTVIEETIDNLTKFQNFDNTLLCKMTFPNFAHAEYSQKYIKGDLPIYQFYSDFGSHNLELKNYVTGITVKTFPCLLKEDNIGRIEDFNVTIRNHTGFPGKSRIYFNIGAPPIPLHINEVFTILNNVDGFNGNYAVVDIKLDLFLGYQYLVINRNYDAPGATSAATGRFPTSTVDFNVYEASLSFLDVPDGKYYLKLTAFDNSTNLKTGLTEPLDIRVTQPRTNYIEYRCNDNAFDLTFTTGYIGRIRIESILSKPYPGGERSISRNSDYGAVKVNAKKTRGFLFETLMLPFYLHEKLSVVFDCDFWTINGVQYQAVDGYSDPGHLQQSLMSNSSIKIEQSNWFDRYNSNDLGSINDGGFVLTETGFLKR